MTHTTCKDDVVTIRLVKDNTLQDSCHAIVVVELSCEIGLCKDAFKEDGTVRTKDTYRYTIVEELLPGLVFHHRQRITTHTVDGHLILLTKPLHVIRLVIGLVTTSAVRTTAVSWSLFIVVFCNLGAKVHNNFIKEEKRHKKKPASCEAGLYG